MLQPLNAAMLLAQVKINQWKSQEELESIQEKKLKACISYASEHVPYYRKGLKGTSVKCLEDLAHLPLVKKPALQTQAESFISDRYPKKSLSKSSTSGSTGTPLTIFHHPSESHHGPTLELHQLTEMGVSPFDLQTHIYYREKQQRLFQRLGLFRRDYLSMFASERENLLALQRSKSSVLVCHPSYLVPLAHENLESGIGLRIDRIFSFSELLSPKARELITRSFGCELYDMYGVMETSWVGWQCEKGSMHLHSDSIIAEIVDREGNPVRKGEYGNIVLTTLWKKSMPLIRYYVGDRTAFGPKCSCGRGLHTLKPIEGRDDDFLVMPSGRVASARLIDLAMRHLPEVLLFQAVQEEAGKIQIKIMPAGKPPPISLQEKFLKDLKKSFHEPMEIKLEVVDRLPRGRTGKIRAVISKVKPDMPI